MNATKEPARGIKANTFTLSCKSPAAHAHRYTDIIVIDNIKYNKKKIRPVHHLVGDVITHVYLVYYKIIVIIISI